MYTIVSKRDGRPLAASAYQDRRSAIIAVRKMAVKIGNGNVAQIVAIMRTFRVERVVILHRLNRRRRKGN